MAAQGFGRQQSLYSITLNEFHNHLNDMGRDLGGMNFDDFMTNIFTADEDMTMIITSQPPISSNEINEINGNIRTFNQNNINGITVAQMAMPSSGPAQADVHNQMASQPSSEHQPLLHIPAALNAMTFEEIWAEIVRGQQQIEGPSASANAVPNPNQSAAVPDTNGEITLEDFLIRVGVCRRHFPPSQHQLPPSQLQAQPRARAQARARAHGQSWAQPQPQQFGTYQNSNINVGPGFVGTSMMGIPGGIGAGASAFQGMPQSVGAIVESSIYGGYNNINAAMFPQQPLTVAYGGRNELGQAVGIPVPISPMTPGGMHAAAPVYYPTGQNGVGMQSRRRRRRLITDGPMEMILAERKRRRMIKNRESAARSRAKKQAYGVQLEAQVEQLRAENAELKKTLRQHRVNEIKNGKAKVNDGRAKEKMMALRRTKSFTM